MQDTLTRYLEGVLDYKSRRHLQFILTPIVDRVATQCLSAAGAGLVIFGAASPVVKTGAADTYFLVQGTLVKIAASTSMPALVGTVTQNKFNVFCFYVDNAGTVTVAMGTEGTAIGNIVFPAQPQGKCMVGFIIVTYAAANFIGGTTALDTATTVYVSTDGGWDASVLV